MRLRCWPAAAFLILLPSAVAAATAPRKSLVEIQAPTPADIDRVLAAGLDVVEVKGDRLRVLALPQDAARIAALGLSAVTVDPDPAATATARSRADMERAGLRWPVPRTGLQGIAAHPRFGLGSMGGFWTTAEVKDFLDSLVADDPLNLVAGKLDTIGVSLEGRPIWGLTLGKQDAGLPSRPTVYYQSLIHAREPQAMQSLLYFAQWLLSRYGSDPEATYLLDHRRIYLCPITNPDGYAVNENTFNTTGSFGLWRKNTRDNNDNGVFDSGDGVDLNRNFGYQWGLDDIGSSPTPGSETYRGTSQFSEPETQAQRSIVDALQPKTGLAFHTYGDYFIFPWGFTPGAAPDSADFFDWSRDATRTNHLILGQAPRTLYRVNGEFNDWVYGETGEKPRGFSWTPEVGNGDDQFWPPQSRILPLSEMTLRPSMVVAYLAGAWVRVRDVQYPSGPLYAGTAKSVQVLVRNKGVGESPGPGLVGTLTPLAPGVWATGATVSYPDIPARSDGTPGATFTLAADDTVTPGRRVPVRIDFTTPGGYFSRDTFDVVVGVPTVVFSDNANSGPGNWTLGTWAIENNDPNHPSPHFSDSPVTVPNPGGFYSNNANNILQLNPLLNLSAGVHAYVELTARWATEQDYDACIVEGSLNGTTWTPLAGRYTKAGSPVLGGAQLPGQPLYDCINYLWTPDRLDLSGFTGSAGTTVRLRFRLRSDGSNTFDGFRFDDMRVIVYDPKAQPSTVDVTAIPPPALALLAPAPNPARHGADIEFLVPTGAGRVRLELLDLQGRRVRVLEDGTPTPGRHRVRWDGTGANGAAAGSGIYFLRLQAQVGSTQVQRLAVMR